MDLNAELGRLQALCRDKPYPSLQERKKLLLALKKGLQSEAYTLADAVSKDFTHRPKEETLFSEILVLVMTINFVVSKMKHWMKNRKRPVSWRYLSAYAYLAPQPLGVVGIITPWNYPLNLSLMPAVFALAAGNRVMIKTSELSPLLGKALKTLIESIGLDEYIVIVNGDVSISKQFAALPFNHLLFTGSTKVGKEVMKAASDNLTPVTLELGGKSPAIISKTMNCDYFTRLFMGKLYNAGQTCIAPDYLLVPASWLEIVEAEFKKFIVQHFPDPMNNEEYTHIISEPHKQRVLALVRDAKDKGARVVQFGEIDSERTKVPIFLLFNVTKDMAVMKEELFAPILPVMTYASFSEAVAFINNGPNPLALYYFGDDKEEIQKLQTNTLSGALSINETLFHVAIETIPFGGVGASGMGHYHGQEGFDTFSKIKPVFEQGRFSMGRFVYPPYGRFLRLILRVLGGIKPEAINRKKG